ncbi:MAG: twin-arginine translocation signal domain-containing protein, partial [Planctomycetota bacterium]
MKSARHGGISRRRFLKATAAGALAVSAVPTIIIPRRV